MEKLINEKVIIDMVKNVLSEETSKVNRNEYNKLQFKIEELENQLIETIKDFRKVEDSVPDGLKTISNNRLKSISLYLYNAHNTLKQLKNKIKEHKRMTYQQEVNEKKI